MWRRLLRLLGMPRPKAPAPDRTNVIDLGEERIKRYGIMFVGFVTDRGVREAKRRRAEERANRLRLVRARE